MKAVTAWWLAHDAGLWALRRACRTAIVMPGLFALGYVTLGNAQLATFAAFGTFAMLLLTDFTGTRRERAEALFWLGLLGSLFVCLGTLASHHVWTAALAMGVLGFAVLFAGIVSSVIATATTSLLLSFVLPVATPAPDSAIPDRVAGWAMAWAAATLAATLLWPAPAREPLRTPLVSALRLVATRLRTHVAWLRGEVDADTHATDTDSARTAANAVRDQFFRSPNRPTGLGTAARTVVRLVDELGWLAAILDAQPQQRTLHLDERVCDVKLAAADVLDQGADLLEAPREDPELLQDAVALLEVRLTGLEAAATSDLRAHPADVGLVSALEPTFRSRELAFAVSSVAANIARAAAAERRTTAERLLGRQPDGAGSLASSVRDRARSHFSLRSVWLHNSLRGGIALAVAVALADATAVQHQFWIVLGTLSVLRSNALSTGQTVFRGLAGTAAGVVAGGLIAEGIGSDTTVLWFLLPVAIVIAGLAPALVGFATGQAAFTVVLVILFNIIAPVGYRVGLVRIEDVGLGFGVSLLVGLLFWPRGATASLRRALGEAYATAADYAGAAVVFGIGRCCSGGVAPLAAGDRAAASARRLDDAFREYLAERGGKDLPLAEVTSLVTGVIAPRLVGDALVELWSRPGVLREDPGPVSTELGAVSDSVVRWFSDFGRAVAAGGDLPEPQPENSCEVSRLLRAGLTDDPSSESSAVVRLIWTGDHLDALRRLEATLTDPAGTLPAPTASPRVRARASA